MAKFRIIRLGDTKPDKVYRLLSQPSTPWTRNLGPVKVEIKDNHTVLLYPSKGGSNMIFKVSEYAKTWGLQEI